jgi:hypothetical protein
MSTSFIFRSFFVYRSLKPVLSISLAFCLIHLVFWMYKIFTYFLITVSTNSLNLSVKDLIFQLSKWILLFLTSFFAPRTHWVKCKDTYSFGFISGHRCNTLLRRWRPDPLSLIIIFRFQYGVSLKWWWLIFLSPYLSFDMSHR